MDSRNVVDYYKEWELDAIKADLDTNRMPFISVFENLSGDFNLARPQEFGTTTGSAARPSGSSAPASGTSAVL